MRTSLRIGAFAVGLAVVFAAALGAGRVVGPVAGAAGHDNPASDNRAGGHDGHGRPGDAAEPPAGLQVTQDGYWLQPLTAALTPGVSTEFAFRVLGPDGAALTRYVSTHERDLHLIVVRRDLSGFQHVHPRLGGDGVWRVPLTVSAAGQYRVFADFRPAGRSAALALGVDVPAPGPFTPTPLPAAAHTVTVDGYTVDLDGELIPGTASRLTLRLSQDGRPVTDLEPYLGAYGHLVTLREGDLAYLHTHPDGAPGDGHTPAGPEVVFYAEVPSAGTYRLYLDFHHYGLVHTAEFTASTAGAEKPVIPLPPNTSAPSEGGHGGHGGHG